MTRSFKINALLGLFLLVIVVVFSLNPISQDPEYHDFYDKRYWLGITNFGNVISNLPYLLVGIMGIATVLKFKNDNSKFCIKIEILPFLVAFIGIFLVGLGSGYYHLNPNNHTLVWDRLPMTIGFAAIFSTIIIERINLKVGMLFLPLLLILGIFSIVYWNYTESLGRGDLRLYALVQFFPILAIPLIIALFPAKYSGTYYLGEMVFWYIIAKLLEYFDGQIFELSSFVISGHSLKHLASAVATYGLVKYIKFRTANS